MRTTRVKLVMQRLNLLSVAALLLVACTSSPDIPATQPVTPTTEVTPQPVALQLGGWGTATEQVNTVLDRFSAHYPHITVDFIPTTSGEYDDVIAAQLAAGTGPDLFYLRSFSGSKALYDAGYLETLDNLTGLREGFGADVLRAWATDDGIPYGVPFTATSHGIYYNEEIYQSVGLSIPETWEDLLATAQLIEEAGYIPFANGSKDDWTLSEIIFMNLAPSFVGGYEGRIAYLEGERCFDDPHIVSVFEAIAQLAPYLPPHHELLGYVDSLELFVQGQAAMWMSGSWDIPYLNKAGLAFAPNVFAIPAPAGETTYVTFHLDVAIGLNAHSTHKSEAQLFLDWMSTDEFAELLGNELPGFFPVHNRVPSLDDDLANAFLALNKQYDTDIRFAWEKLGEETPTAYNLILDGSRGVLTGAITPEEAANQLQEGLATWFAPAQTCR